ncbi:MAG: LysR family transcriptional regulator substrate-binding protein [Oscillospiraceae bacterium]|nr:LysR family transcriptional regulator substrate-binding protein [Oscillospiraceae bacterium]
MADLKRKHTEDPETARYNISYSVFPAWNITSLLSDNAAYIQQKHPNWEPSLKICRAETLIDALRDGEVDVIFYVDSLLSRYPEFARLPLTELPQMILYTANDPLAAKPNLTPEDFRERDFLYVPDSVMTPEIMQRQVRSVERRYGFTFRARVLENVDSLTMALETGQGVALMDYWSRYRTNPHLKALTLDLPLPVVVAWRQDCANPAVPRFAADTVEYFQTHLY